MHIRGGKKIFLSIAALAIASVIVGYFALPAHGAVKVWKGTTNNNWNTASNWSPSGVPSSSDVATFDNTCTNCNATIDANANVQGFDIQSTYSGTITQSGSNTITIGSSGWTQAGGTFIGGTASITFNGAFSLSGGTFTATSGTLNANRNWTYASGTINPNGGTVVFTAPSCSNLTITGSHTLASVTTREGGCLGEPVIIASGTTLTVTGTLTLASGLVNTGTIEAQGNISAAGGYRGGTATILIDGTGNQTMTGSMASNGTLPAITINKSSGTLSLSGTFRVMKGWTYTAGSLDPGTSTVMFTEDGCNGSATITGSHTLTNVTFTGINCSGTATVSIGTTLTVSNSLAFIGESSFGSVNGGTIVAQGNISFANAVRGGTATILINGTGDQTMTGTMTSSGSAPNITINKSSGILSLSGTIRTQRLWTYTSGIISPGSSTLVFLGDSCSASSTITGSHTLGNVVFSYVNCGSTITVSSGTTLTVSGNLTFLQTVYVASGTIAVQGDVSVVSGAYGGSALLQFTGGKDQTFTNSGGTNLWGNVTINKTGGTVTLGSNADWNAASQSLTITSGALSVGNYNLSIGSGGLSIGSAGALRGFGTGDLTLAGNVANSGEITLRSNRSCGGTDSILIRSSNTVQRNWTGSGTFTLHDVNVSYQTGSSAITVYSGTNAGNNGANWTFSGAACPATTPAVSVSSGILTVESGSMNVY